MVDDDLDGVDLGAAREVALRFQKRHEHHGAVVFRHAHLEQRGDHIGLGARRRAEGRRRAARRNERDRIADVDAQHVGKARADGDAGALAEPVEAAEADVVGDERQRAQSFLGHAAHERAGGLHGRGDHDLALDQRHRRLDVLHAGNALGHLVVVFERAADLVDDDVAVETEDLGEQLVAEAVHHRHDDDQSGDAEHDAREGETGDNGDEAFGAACPQVARRQHPLIGRERQGIPCDGRALCRRSYARHAASPPCSELT